MAENVFKRVIDKIKYNLSEIRFANSKKKDLHLLLRATDDFNLKKIEEKEQLKNQELTSFETTEEEIIKFVEKFIDVSIPNPELREKLKKAMQGFELVALEEGQEFDGAPGRVGFNGEKIEKYAVVGTKTPDGKIKTTLKNIEIFAHEVFHAASLKHNVEHIEDSIQRQLPVEASTEIGEIETMFLEGIFTYMLSERVDEFKVGEEYPFGLTREQIINDAKLIDFEQFDSFRNKMKSVKDKRDIDENNKKSKKFRYILGFVSSNGLIEMFKKNPEQATEILCEYLNNDAKLDLNDAMAVLNGGKVHINPDKTLTIQGKRATYHDKMQEFIQMYNPQKENNNENASVSHPEEEIKGERDLMGQEKGETFEVETPKRDSVEESLEEEIEKGKEG